MYTTAEAVQLLVRAGLQGSASLATPMDYEIAETFVQLQVAQIVAVRRAPIAPGGEPWTQSTLELTDVGHTVYRETQRAFERLLALCRAADDRRPHR